MLAVPRSALRAYADKRRWGECRPGQQRHEFGLKNKEPASPPVMIRDGPSSMGLCPGQLHPPWSTGHPHARDWIGCTRTSGEYPLKVGDNPAGGYLPLWDHFAVNKRPWRRMPAGNIFVGPPPGRKFPPRRPGQNPARNWIGCTCSGETRREPFRRNHTSPSPQNTTAAKQPHRWSMPYCEPGQNQKNREAIPAHALIVPIKAKPISGHRTKQTQTPATTAMLHHTNRTHIPLNVKHLNFSTFQLFNFSTFQLFNFSTFQLLTIKL